MTGKLSIWIIAFWILGEIQIVQSIRLRQPQKQPYNNLFRSSVWKSLNEERKAKQIYFHPNEESKKHRYSSCDFYSLANLYPLKLPTLAHTRISTDIFILNTVQIEERIECTQKIIEEKKTRWVKKGTKRKKTKNIGKSWKRETKLAQLNVIGILPKIAVRHLTYNTDVYTTWISTSVTIVYSSCLTIFVQLPYNGNIKSPKSTTIERFNGNELDAVRIRKIMNLLSTDICYRTVDWWKWNENESEKCLLTSSQVQHAALVGNENH